MRRKWSVLSVTRRGLEAVAVAEDGFQDDAEGDGEAGEVGFEVGGELGEGVELVARAGGGEGGERQRAEVRHGVMILSLSLSLSLSLCKATDYRLQADRQVFSGLVV